MRNLAHPMNLGQCFLRKVQADMVFRLDHILLKLKNGVTKLIDRRSTINAKSVDKRFQTIIDKHTNSGKNPPVYREDTLSLPKSGYNQTALTPYKSAYKAFTTGKHLLKGHSTSLITVRGSKQYSQTTAGVGVIQLEPDNNSKMAKEFLSVHPGVYSRNGDEINVFVTNFRKSDQVIPSDLLVGYLWELAPINTPSTSGLISALDKRDPKDMTVAEINEWRTFIIKELKLDDNEILSKDPQAKEQIIEAFMENLGAIAKDGHDYGNTDLVQFHLEIEPNAKPVRQKVRPLNPIQTSDLERQLDEWTKEGVIEPSRSEWASPLVPVIKKASSKLRWCVDFRALNKVTKRDSFPLNSVETCLSQLSESDVFSTLDSCGAYHAVTIHPDSRDFTSFIAPQGLFRFKKLPFGLCNAGATYSRLIDIALNIFKTKGFAIGYLDDVICYSKGVIRHIPHLRCLLKMHTQFGLKINLSKCEICQPKVKYLGHIVSSDGFRMDPEHVTKILDWPPPETGKEMKSFLGFCNYYRQFICEYGELSAPLTTVQNSKGKITWTALMKKNFEKLKLAFASQPVRAYPDFKENAAPFTLDTDYSKLCTAGVLSQLQNGREVFLGCTAKKNNKAEALYPSYKGELLSIIKAIKKFEHLLLARKFVIRTDSSALTYLTTMKNSHGLFARWAVYLADFDFDVIHRAGKKHLNADILSRREDIEIEEQHTAPGDEEKEFPISYLDEGMSRTDWTVPLRGARNQSIKNNAFSPMECGREAHPDISNVNEENESDQFMLTVPLNEIETESQKDYVLRTVMDCVRHQYKPTKAELEGMSLEVKKYIHIFECLQVKKNVLFFNTPSLNGQKSKSRICLPDALQKKAWQAAHANLHSGHIGVNRTYDVLRDRFYFHDMHSFISMQNRNCVVCVTKLTSPGKSTHLPFRRKLGCFNQLVYTDTVGPLQPPNMYLNKKCSNILTIQDGFTRFLVAVPVKDLTAATIAESIVEHWIHRFSAPSQIHSDNGPAYASELMSHVMRRFNIQKTFSPPAVPEANVIERAHKVINQLLRTDRSKPVENWVAKLSTICFVYNTTVNRHTGISPLHCLTGVKPQLPIDMVFGLYQPKTTSWTKYVDTLNKRYHDLYKKLCEQNETVIALNNSSHKPNWRHEIDQGDTVYYFLSRIKPGITKKLQIRWCGPWRVDRRLSNSLFLISPIGDWCTRPRQVVTICSRLRKIDPQINLDNPHGDSNDQIDLPAVLDNYNDLSNEDVIAFPISNQKEMQTAYPMAGPVVQPPPVEPIPLPPPGGTENVENAVPEIAIPQIKTEIIESPERIPETICDTPSENQEVGESVDTHVSTGSSDEDVEPPRRVQPPRRVKFRDINYDEKKRRNK